jgi:predicted Fe-Mo cluster-binding NifX family protein
VRYLRIAIATKGHNGLDDEISTELARSPTITLIDIDEEKKSYQLIEVIENKAVNFSHGAGPVFAYLMKEKNVELVVGPDIGEGVQELFNELKIKFLKYKSKTKVKEVISDLLGNG